MRGQSSEEKKRGIGINAEEHCQLIVTDYGLFTDTQPAIDLG